MEEIAINCDITCQVYSFQQTVISSSRKKFHLLIHVKAFTSLVICSLLLISRKFAMNDTPSKFDTKRYVKCVVL